jgi:hypothetical protein
VHLVAGSGLSDPPMRVNVLHLYRNLLLTL